MADADTDAGQIRPRRRGRRLLIVLLVLLILVVVALTVADRVGAAYAEREIAQRVSAEVRDQGLQASPPEVTVVGVPFLTQVLAGEYEQIKILLRDVAGEAVGGRSLRMPVLDIRAHDVRAPLQALRSGQGEIVAGTVNGTATIDYASVARLIGREGVQLAERNGELTVTAPLEVLGQQLTLNGTADLSITGGTVQIRFRDLTATGVPDLPLAQGLINAYAQQISIDVDLPPLPLGLVVRDVQPRPEGLLVTATATDVPLNQGV